VLGTFIALVPNLVRAPARVRQEDSVGVPPAAGLGAASDVAKVPHA
jgi:hypothetical protein